MRLVFAPTEEKAAKTAISYGLKPGISCILVWDLESMERTCLMDYIQDPIEEDSSEFTLQTKIEMVNYLNQLRNDYKKGFGWRNWFAKPTEK